VIDPLGGAYFIERSTDQLEREAEALFAEIASIGGVVRGIETGWFQRQIAQSAAAFHDRWSGVRRSRRCERVPVR